ncbi:MAG: hypothetical protein BWX86_01648 [Verrucomicrobia bacterium ADurb.Bin122]|nr:MAG: hypothetical protein BWX86_01648 [Verrucomicrobia bacterium ADurb.Bin122]
MGGQAELVAVEHAHEHVDGCLAGKIVVLVHAGPVEIAAAALKLDQPDIVGHA